MLSTATATDKWMLCSTSMTSMKSWWHHLRCNIPSTTLPWPLHAKSITAQTKCVHMPLVGGFVANIDVQLHHIVILQNTTSTRPYNLGLNFKTVETQQMLGHTGPIWKKPSDFFLGPYSHTMSYNIWLVVEPYPLKNDGVKVSWAYDIPNMMGK